MMKRLLVITLLAGCAGSLDGQQNGDANTPSDAMPPCDFSILFDPAMPTADPLAQIRAQATLVGAPGVYTYTWNVSHGGTVPFTYEASDYSQIGFVAPTPGGYVVTVDISGGAQTTCNHASSTIYVGDPNANNSVYRLRTVASPQAAPPQEQVIQIPGGADYPRNIPLDPGLSRSGMVKSGSAGVSAYMKFTPVGAPNAFIETFASATNGSYTVRVMGGDYNVLVIPASTSLAPKLFPWQAGGSVADFIVTSGTLVNGTVKNPAGNGFGGAKVQLFAGGVPSTLATTAADGSFSVHTDFPASTMITVEVTPPAATGLPRMSATGMFDTGQQVQVTYASTLATCDIGGDPVKRGGVNQANAKVTVVGTLATTPGTVTTGTTTINATGTVRIATVANGSGQLPSTLVPRSSTLSAVVQLAATDFAVDPIDTSACAAQTIDALAPITRTGTTSNVSGALGGVRIEAMPIGSLALADAQPIVATSDSGGAFSIDLAAGGRYNVRFTDPLARAAPLVVLDIAPASVPGAPTLPKALMMSGKVTISANPNPVIGASIQLLCATCTGIEATRPISQTATDAQSNYRLAVPDPGTL